MPGETVGRVHLKNLEILSTDFSLSISDLFLPPDIKG